MPGMTTHHADITADPIALALTDLEASRQHASDARDARNLDDHPLAGRFREEQRAATKRAEVNASISQAISLQRIADALDRFALSL